MRSSFLDYAMSVIVVARAARRARRAEAGAPARALLDARQRPPAEPAARQVRERRRRGDEELPPARRLGDLRHARPPRAAVLDALPAGRRPGQLREHRRLSRPRPCATRSAGSRGSPRSCCATSTPTRSTSGRTTTSGAREPHGAAGALPEPARQRLVGIAVGMATNIPPHHLGETIDALVAMIDDPHDRRRPADEAHQGPGLPDRRDHPRPRRHPRGVPLGPRPHRHARPRAHRGAARRPHRGRRHRAALRRSRRAATRA